MCIRDSYNIGIMVEDGEHIGEGIQYPGAVFIAKTFLGKRRRMRGKLSLIHIFYVAVPNFF